MFPSSDPAIPNTTTMIDDHDPSDAMPSTADAMDCEIQRSVDIDSPGAMAPSYPTTATKVSHSPAGPLDKPTDSAFEIYTEYAPVRSPTRNPKAASYSQLSPAARPAYSQPAASRQSTPESTADYPYGENYYGPSDISVRRSASSTEADDLFSDVEDSNLDDSGFEPTETAELPIQASGALHLNEDTARPPVEDEHSNQTHDLSDNDSDSDEGPDDEAGDVTRLRNVSYESYPNANSPTESQLIDEGFEFHNQLPEHRQAGQFQNEAFREALRDVSPHLPRKQQWYAWRKVMEMMDNDNADKHDDLFDDSDLPNDFSLGSLAEHHFGGCHCGGDAAKCACAPGQCAFNACPRRAREDQPMKTNETEAEAEDGEEDVPMVIGYTPITPMFPELHQPHQLPIKNEQRLENQLPGLEKHQEENASIATDSRVADHGYRSSGSNCGCTCGDQCRCPQGQCQCDSKDESVHQWSTADHERRDSPAAVEELDRDVACDCSCGSECPCQPGQCRCNDSAVSEHPIVPPGTTVDQLFDDPFKRPAAFSHAQETWSDAATAGQSPAPADLREPRGLEPHFPPIASQLSVTSIFSPNDAPTPSQGLHSPDSEAPTPTSQLISRPDTPRPQGDTYQFGIRQSVEPELLSPVPHRQSTPAYENRSLTPSPMSHNTPSDTSMHDATPTQPPMPAAYDRESSVLPDAPPVVAEAPSPPDSPLQHIPPVPAIPVQHQPGHLAQYAHIPAPPIPVSPTLKPRKQRATSTSANGNGRRNTKSAVHGSKITKAQPKQRNVTRKATGKKVKAAVDRIEDTVRQTEEDEQLEKQRVSSRGSVRSWSAEDVVQKDGSPPRRSARVRQRVASPLMR